MKVSYEKELDKIKEIVKKKPRGVTIKEISKKIGVNRNVVAKYLDVLQIEGEVEVETFGRSKVYFPSKSVPISAMFDYASELIVVVRKDMTTVEINNPLIEYLGLPSKSKAIGKHIETLALSKSYPKMTKNIVGALESHKILEDKITYKRKNRSRSDHLKVKFIPTTLNDGEQGIAVIISKI